MLEKKQKNDHTFKYFATDTLSVNKINPADLM